jgi:hypothetical protein
MINTEVFCVEVKSNLMLTADFCYLSVTIVSSFMVFYFSEVDLMSQLSNHFIVPLIQSYLLHHTRLIILMFDWKTELNLTTEPPISFR